MLTDEHLQREVEPFGAAEEQVRRDHAISHLLAAPIVAGNATARLAPQPGAAPQALRTSAPAV
jgi:hypothetical protein